MIKFKDIKSLKKRILAVTFVFLFVITMIGFNAAPSLAVQPHAIHFLASARSYTATMAVNAKAEDVWQSVVDIAKKRNPNNLEIKEENIKDLKFEATKTAESGDELWVFLKVTPVSETSCELIFTATMKGGTPLKNQMREMVLESLQQFCKEKGLTCETDK